jgi:hypothetical protein
MESQLIFAITWLAVLVQVICAIGGAGIMAFGWSRGDRLVAPIQILLLRLSLIAMIVASIFPFLFEVLGSLARGIEMDTIVFFAGVIGLHLLHQAIVRIATARDAKHVNVHTAKQ